MSACGVIVFGTVAFITVLIRAADLWAIVLLAPMSSKISFRGVGLKGLGLTGVVVGVVVLGGVVLRGVDLGGVVLGVIVFGVIVLGAIVFGDPGAVLIKWKKKIIKINVYLFRVSWKSMLYF